MFLPSTQDLILAGVVLHLTGSLAKAVFTKPQQRAQIDAIEGKVDAVLTQVQQAIAKPASAPSPAVAADNLTLGLNPVPTSAQAPSVQDMSAQDMSAQDMSAQGGAS